ncbi:hypothetical protein SAMN05428952_10236 [Nitrosomonas sp. Nm132]|nr:hypothetical protein SAMN05428952_10236 [Nitrosomonas sp. Nm132]
MFMLNRLIILIGSLSRVVMLLTGLHPSWINAAERPDLKGLQVHGFLSQGYIKTTATRNDVFGDSTRGRGSFDFREIGVNASYRPLTNLQFSGQLLSRQTGEDSKGGIRIDYGFVDYTAITTETKEVGVRLGRTKNPFGFYNETRDVPFTRPSILLPQSIYFDRARNLALASDGIQLYGESRSDWGDVTLQFVTGFPQVDDKSTEAAILRKNQSGDLTPRLSYLGRLIYERDGGRLRLAISGAQVNVGYDPAAKDRLSSGSIEFFPLIFSAQYNAEHWSITSEYALRHIEMKNFHPLVDKSFTGESFYFQGIYRFSPAWEAVLRYDVLFTDRKDRDGSEWHVKTGFPSDSRFAKDLTVGLRWNITPAIMLRGEYHRVNGTAWLSTLDNPDPAFTDRHWNLFAAQVSYRF